MIAVTWDGAQAYCQSVGERLPTEAEWEKAARGTESLIYPWGDTPPTGSLLNLGDVNHPEGVGDASLDDGYPQTAPTGSFPQGASPYSIYDMAGNVWEWLADWYGEETYAQSPSANPLGPETGDWKITRGGSWYDLPEYVRTSYRAAFSPDYAGNLVGFRCATSDNQIEFKPTPVPTPTATPAPDTFSITFDDAVFSVAFSPDGKLLAASSSAQVYILDTTSWQIIQTLEVTKPWDMDWTLDGRFLATGYSIRSIDKEGIRIWNTANWEIEQTIDWFNQNPANASPNYSPDGKLIAGKLNFSFDDTRVKIFRVSSGREIFEIKTHPYPGPKTRNNKLLSDFSWSPDGELFAVGHTSDVNVSVWNTKTWEPLFTTVGLYQSSLGQIEWSPDGNYILGARSDGGLVIWDAETGEVYLNLFGHNERIMDFAFSPNGKLLATASWDESIIIWDTETWQILTTLENHDGPVYTADFSPDGTLLATGSADDTIIIWNVAQELP